jgi:hypothetical protein
MAEKPIPVSGWKGVDTTTDEFLLGQTDPTKSVLAYNYRVKNGVRVGRTGFTPVIDFASSEYLKKSGVYFPPGSKAIFPHTSIEYTNSFYLAGTQEAPQTEFTIELWYRGIQNTEYTTFLDIPVDFGTDINAQDVVSVVKLRFTPTTQPGQSSLQAFVMLGDNATAEVVGQQEYINAGVYVDLDDEWHHLAVYMKSSDQANLYYVLDGGSEVTMAAQQTLTGYDYLAGNDTHKDSHVSPKYYQHMEIGGDGISIAEFRIWGDRRSATEITDFKDVELDGDEDNLLVYIPFNEGDGKTFTDAVSGIGGYFTPQAPYVNDDNELVFTGHNCMAYPSLRPHWVPPEDDSTPTHDLDNQDAAYDGGIVWDTVLNLETLYDWDQEGIQQGVFQMRIRLHQLKEGVLCGRLGMFYDNSDEAYRLFFIDPTNAWVYMSNAIIDASWIGVEKTITVYYQGVATNDPEDIGTIYVDTANVSDSSTTTEGVWGNAANDDILTTTSYWPYTDTEGTNDTSGAIGGSTEQSEMCIAFDLIFFRQWIGYPPNHFSCKYL